MNAQVIGLLLPQAINFAVQTTPLDVSNKPNGEFAHFDSKRAGAAAKASQTPGEHHEVSREELAAMLTEVNLSYDPFEIEASFSMSKQGQRVIVTLRNTRTGEIIRKIPPDEFASKLVESNGKLGLWFNRKV